jgi:hypothetical protein
MEPQGAAIIWNYDSRLNTTPGFVSFGGNDEVSSATPQKLDEVIILTASLKSMSTTKYKSKPEGRFELRLAPTFNWVTRITPGSWCTLMMQRDGQLPPMHPQGPLLASSTKDKFFGKIESVRQHVTVDGSGARHTEYIVTGVDWADAFNQIIYIDPLVSKNLVNKQSTLGAANFLFYSDLIHSYTQNQTGLPSAGEVVKSLIRLWGSPLKELSDAVYNSTNILGAVENSYQIPPEVVAYFKFSSKLPFQEQQPQGVSVPNSVDVADILDIKEGILEGDDTYSGDLNEAKGFPEPNSIMGTNSVWKLILANCNYTINEVIADLSWDNEFQAQPTLFRRIRPFVNRPNFPGNSDVKELVSLFKDVKTTEIPLKDVITINFGTNVRDRINFVELLPSASIMPNVLDLLKQNNKLDAQVYDSASISRDGLKPIIDRNIKYIPFKGNTLDPSIVSEWKHLVKEWHFNTHVMLNGSLTMVGQNEYIRVGDNIRINAKVLGENNFNEGQIKSDSPLSSLLSSSTEYFFTAHVESISHSFSVDQMTGARSYKTSISFVRGIITDKKGEPIIDTNIAIDEKATDQTAVKQQKNINNLGRSTDMDPDLRKLKGN